MKIKNNEVTTTNSSFVEDTISEKSTDRERIKKTSKNNKEEEDKNVLNKRDKVINKDVQVLKCCC
ncbi:21569_t:CDS:2 [Rhizophagus irregularis]|nr:21569_t:CDS:2 [Rhizophagus irregularis]